MADVVLVAIALLITLGVFLAVRPLWRRRNWADHGQTLDNSSDSRDDSGSREEGARLGT